MPKHYISAEQEKIFLKQSLAPPLKNTSARDTKFLLKFFLIMIDRLELEQSKIVASMKIFLKKVQLWEHMANLPWIGEG